MTAADGEDLTRPLMIGYLHRQLLVTDGQVDGLKSQFAAFARAEGYSMGSTYVEYPGSWPAAFEALIQAVNRYEAAAVVLPSLLHFAALGGSAAFKAHFEGATGTRVLVAEAQPGDRKNPHAGWRGATNDVGLRQPFHLPAFTDEE